jgi:hypothetical protein
VNNRQFYFKLRVTALTRNYGPGRHFDCETRKILRKKEKSEDGKERQMRVTEEAKTRGRQKKQKEREKGRERKGGRVERREGREKEGTKAAKTGEIERK